MVSLCFNQKYRKTNNWEWWWAPVNPATREAEAGESLEPGRQRVSNQDHATALQPGQQSKTPSQKKK